MKLNKYILEVRYDPILSAFDNRGTVLKNIWKPFEYKMKHWQVENVNITLSTEPGKPSKQIHIGHTRSFINYENCDTKQEFEDDAKKFIKLLTTTYPEIQKINRSGYREIQFIGENGTDIGKYYKIIRDNYLNKNIPLTLPIFDAVVVLEHKFGKIQIGSIKNEDKFLEREFPSNYNTISGKYVGIYCDIDTYTECFELHKKSNLVANVSDLINAGAATLNEINKVIMAEVHETK